MSAPRARRRHYVGKAGTYTTKPKAKAKAKATDPPIGEADVLSQNVARHRVERNHFARLGSAATAECTSKTNMRSPTALSGPSQWGR
jgi:hypothetical protein